MSIKTPIFISDMSPSIRNGAQKPPIRANALAAECPVLRISVGKISAVEIQVTHDPAISQTLQINATTTNNALFISKAEKRQSISRLLPPIPYEQTWVGILPTLSTSEMTSIVPTISAKLLMSKAL
mmetsp:Transcript_23343/g.29434  ORF Transcript_23343/g.29434 Transcript_23343/m.29434 type:complete len:126 (+) Transcript_23343:1901-2278(+)